MIRLELGQQKTQSKQCKFSFAAERRNSNSILRQLVKISRKLTKIREENVSLGLSAECPNSKVRPAD